MFSIIVPVYNAEKYLDRCIGSVVSQTNKNWELLLIDDGSSDKSWEIIEYYMKRDRRIKGIKQENSGAGVARNKGIDEAVGEYAVFLDSDDYITENYLQLVEKKTATAEVIFIDALQVDANGKVLKKENMSDFKKVSRDSLHRSMMTGKAPWGGGERLLV